MIEKLQAVSRILIIPTVALYLCGFICVTGYLARFGIVSFEIVNARFLVAGMHAILPLIFCGWFNWTLTKQIREMPEGFFFSAKNTPYRVLFYGQLLFVPLGGATALNAFYQVANFAKMSDPAAAPLQPIFGQNDPIGRTALGINIFGQSDLGFIFVTFIYILFTAVIVIGLISAILFALLRYQAYRIRNAPAPTQELPQSESSEPIQKPALLDRIGNSLSNPTWTTHVITTAVDMVFISALVALAFFSYWKIRSEIFDAEAFGASGPVYSIIYSWIFGTTSVVLLFTETPFAYGKLTFDKLGMLTPSDATEVMYRFAVPLLSSIFLFGATIFPRLPIAIGGGEPRPVSISIKDSTSQPFHGRVYLLGESSQFIFVVQIGREITKAFEINKDDVQTIETWRKSQPAKPKSTPAKPTGDLKLRSGPALR